MADDLTGTILELLVSQLREASAISRGKATSNQTSAVRHHLNLMDQAQEAVVLALSSKAAENTMPKTTEVIEMTQTNLGKVGARETTQLQIGHQKIPITQGGIQTQDVTKTLQGILMSTEVASRMELCKTASSSLEAEEEGEPVLAMATSSGKSSTRKIIQAGATIVKSLTIVM